jgi:hypothetical protein
MLDDLLVSVRVAAREVAPFLIGPSTSPAEGPCLVGSVGLAGGGWSGHLEVWVSLSVARAAAAELYDLPYLGVGDADIRDLVGELSNVVAGRAIDGFPGRFVMCTPRVWLEGEEPCSATTSCLRDHVTCDGFVVGVAVLE